MQRIPVQYAVRNIKGATIQRDQLTVCTHDGDYRYHICYIKLIPFILQVLSIWFQWQIESSLAKVNQNKWTWFKLEINISTSM